MNNFHKIINLPIKFIEPDRLSQLKSLQTFYEITNRHYSEEGG